MQVNFRMITGGRIKGRVISDINGNGKQDPGEKGISDVLVQLAPGGQNTYTDDEGRFIFENILPGEYTLKLDPASLPEDTVFTSPEELKIEILPGGELKEKNFLIQIKPRPIIIGPPQK